MAQKRRVLSRDYVFGRIDTTILSRNSNVMQPCETSIIAEQDAVIVVTSKVTMATGKQKHKLCESFKKFCGADSELP